MPVNNIGGCGRELENNGAKRGTRACGTCNDSAGCMFEYATLVPVAILANEDGRECEVGARVGAERRGSCTRNGFVWLSGGVCAIGEMWGEVEGGSSAAITDAVSGACREANRAWSNGSEGAGACGYIS